MKYEYIFLCYKQNSNKYTSIMFGIHFTVVGFNVVSRSAFSQADDSGEIVCDPLGVRGGLSAPASLMKSAYM